jgi:hypothetical protein
MLVSWGLSRWLFCRCPLILRLLRVFTLVNTGGELIAPLTSAALICWCGGSAAGVGTTLPAEGVVAVCGIHHFRRADFQPPKLPGKFVARNFPTVTLHEYGLRRWSSRLYIRTNWSSSFPPFGYMSQNSSAMPQQYFLCRRNKLKPDWQNFSALNFDICGFIGVIIVVLNIKFKLLSFVHKYLLFLYRICTWRDQFSNVNLHT